MPETSTMTRAWRTDAAGGRVSTPGPGAGAWTGGDPAPAGPAGRPSWRAGGAGLRRLVAAVAWAGRAAWSRAFGRPADRFEEALLGFTADLAESGDPEAVELALLRIARRLAPACRVELRRATGEGPLSEDGACVADADADGEGPGPEEYPVRCGAADHGVLRIHRDGAAGPPETSRRLAMACTLAACALESARLQAEWGRGAEDTAPDGGDGDGDESGMRAPHRPRDVVRDATFLNAVLPFALEQSRRHGEPVALICARVDRLGAIRDLLGPALADRMVHELGELVGSLVRASDLVARLDDDRVVALLMRARGDGALKVARSIARAAAEAGPGALGLPGTTVSIGVAEFPAVARDASALLDAADEAMARARARGGRSPVLAGPDAEGGPARILARPAPMARAAGMAACG